MNYNLFLFSKLADGNLDEYKKVYEIDLKWDKLQELYKDYEVSRFPAMLKYSDHDAMLLWMQERNNKSTIDLLADKVHELKWRLACIKDDAYEAMLKIRKINTIDDETQDSIDRCFLDIEIALDLHSNECFTWTVSGKQFNQ
jgi:hypothetical protein